MLDLKQLDNIFNAESLKQSNADEAALLRQRKKIRLIKIVFPAIAAALVGLLAVIPSLQDRGDFSIKISKPLRNEIEKLHVENSVLYVTDKANRVNTFTAEHIDETAPGSQLVKLQNPKGKMPTSDEQWVDVTAPTGFYDQNTKVFSLVDNVVAVYSDGMTAKTEEIYYDSHESRAFGNKPIIADGKFGHLKAEAFEYLTDQAMIRFKGKTDIVTDAAQFGNKIDIKADKKVEFFRSQQKLVATGNAVMTRTGLKVNGDVLTAVFAKDSNGKNAISDFYGDGKVVVDNGKNKVSADHLKAFFKKSGAKNSAIDRIEMTGNVKTKNAEGEVYAQKGIYYPDSGEVKLFDEVVIVKDGNRMQGETAETNLNTGVSKMGAGTKKRISGVIYEDGLKINK